MTKIWKNSLQRANYAPDIHSSTPSLKSSIFKDKNSKKHHFKGVIMLNIYSRSHSLSAGGLIYKLSRLAGLNRVTPYHNVINSLKRMRVVKFTILINLRVLGSQDIVNETTFISPMGLLHCRNYRIDFNIQETNRGRCGVRPCLSLS